MNLEEESVFSGKMKVFEKFGFDSPCVTLRGEVVMVFISFS